MSRCKMTPKRLEHLRKIARKGGRALVEKHGVDHMINIGKRGAIALHERYKLQPCGVAGWCLVDRRTNEIKSTFGLPDHIVAQLMQKQNILID